MCFTLQINTKKVFVLAFIILIIGILSAEDTIKIENSQVKFNDNVNVAWNSNVEAPSSIGDMNSFKIKGDGSLTVQYYGDTRTYNNFDSSKRNEFLFNKSGILKEAYFTPAKDGKYKLGNKEFFVPAGSDVVYKEGVATINYKKEKIERAKLIEGMKGSEDTTLVYKSDKGFILENGAKFSGILKYDNRGFFFDSDAKIGSINVKNSEGTVPTYLFFDGEKNNINAAYISFDETKGKITLGCNLDVRGPAVSFDENNPYGIRLEKGDNFQMKALGNSQGSYISIQNREKDGKVPYIETLNQWVMNEDSKSVYFNTDDHKLHIKTDGILISEFGQLSGKTTTTPLEIHNYQTIDNKIIDVSKYKNVLGIGNNNNFGYGNNPLFIKTNVPDYYLTKRAPGLYTGFSSSLTYNYDHTLRGLQKFTGIPISDKTGVTNDPRNVQMLMDIFASLPTNNFKSWGISEMEIGNFDDGWSGLADKDGIFKIDVSNGGFNPGVIRHELTHLHDFTFSSSSNFQREWNSIGGSSGPHTYDYGYTDAEDTSTFAEFTYRQDPWRGWLSSSYQYNAKFRGRIAIFVKYGFMSRSEAARLYSLGGLPADASDATLSKYIVDAQNAYRILG